MLNILNTCEENSIVKLIAQLRKKRHELKNNTEEIFLIDSDFE